VNAIAVALQAVPGSIAEARALALQNLLDLELALLSPRATSKRVAEFVAGRVAARRAVRRLLSRTGLCSTFAVLREGDGPTGCPKVVGSGLDDKPICVSISHADGIATAAASHQRLGIDIATIQHQEASFLAEAFNPRELAAWGSWLRSEPTSPLTVTTAFAAKEAALKLLGTGFGLGLRAIVVLPHLDDCGGRIPRSARRGTAFLNRTEDGAEWPLAAVVILRGSRVSVLLQPSPVHSRLERHDCVKCSCIVPSRAGSWYC